MKNKPIHSPFLPSGPCWELCPLIFFQKSYPVSFHVTPILPQALHITLCLSLARFFLLPSFGELVFTLEQKGECKICYIRHSKLVCSDESNWFTKYLRCDTTPLHK